MSPTVQCKQTASHLAWSSMRLKLECSEDGDVAVDFGSVSLGDALADPDDVATLLLLQFDERVKCAEVKLLHKGVLHKQHLQTSSRIYL